MTEVTRTEADSIRDIMRSSLEIGIHALEGVEDQPNVDVISVPAGTSIISIKKFLDEYRTAPERKKGTATLTDLASFIAHAIRFKGPNSAIFTNPDPKAPSMLSVFDYHEATPDGSPRFGEHRGRYAFPVSSEWTAWTSANGSWMKLADFAAFLEQRLADVTEHQTESAKAFGKLYGCSFASAAKLLELSRGLSLRVEQRVESHANLATGEGTVVFAEKHEGAAGETVKVPGAFLIAIPVFRNGTPYVISARLRYRIQSGAPIFSYELHRLDAVFDDAIALAVEEARKTTELPVFMGTPEA